jgi:ribonuclease P protein component
MPRYRFTKRQRLRTSAEFARVYERKLRAGDDVLLAFAAANDLGFTRLGLSVSRKQGNAVVRARRKRLLREAFRLEQYELPAGLDLVLIPRAGVEATLEQYQRSLTRLAGKLARKLEASS